jgi:hypothetical protein
MTYEINRANMKVLAIIFNIVLFLFTFFVLVTDGLPVQVRYMFATMWVVLTPVITIMVIYLSRSKYSGIYFKANKLKILAVLFNFALIVYAAWGIFQTHPAEAGYIPYLVLVSLTPIFNLITIFFFISTNQKTV